MPKHLLDRYFHRRGDKYLLSRELLERIEFRTFNLFKDPLPYLDVPFDIIFLRNVLIYFRPESQRRVLARIARRLAADGYLFLGHSETLWQLSEELEIVELTDCLAYRLPRPSTAPGTQPPPSRRSGSTPAQRAAVRAALRLKKRASGQTDRRPDAHLAERSAPADPERGAAPGQELEAAERALAANDVDAAKDLVQRRLRANSTDAHAHALQGLIHDLEGRARRAVAAYRAALFLEPDLFQVRFLLAGRLQHLGWSSRARSEYRHVLSGLERGRGHELSEHLPQFLPSRDETAQRCRRALRRV
ncbi:MAG: methyltransferase domain-containing protein [bacterium]|nr:methyltransferase domain-containing protein [bacterium]